MHYPSTVEVLTDEELLSSIDVLLRASHPPFDRVMTRLIDLDWRPNGQASAFILAMALFNKQYVYHRGEADVVEHLDRLVSRVLPLVHHPVAPLHLAQPREVVHLRRRAN